MPGVRTKILMIGDRYFLCEEERKYRMNLKEQLKKVMDDQEKLERKKDKFLEKRRIEDDWLVADDVRREFYKLGISIPREKKHGENEFHTKYHVPYYKI